MNTADRYNDACGCHGDIHDAYSYLCNQLDAPDYLKHQLSETLRSIDDWCTQLENEIDPDDLNDGSHPSLTAAERNPNLR